MTITGPRDRILDEWAKFRFQNRWGDADDESDPLGPEHLSIQEDGPDKLAIVFEAIDWKWYDSYPSIHRVEALWSHFHDLAAMDEVDTTITNLSGAFARIGEDDNDVDTRRFGDGGYDLVSVTRVFETAHSHNAELDVRSTLQKRPG